MSQLVRLEGKHTCQNAHCALEQLHSSMVNHNWWLQKILLPWPCSTRFYQELLSLHQLASRQHQHQQVEGGPEEYGFGGQVVQEVVEQHPFSGSAHFGRQLCLFICHPSRGLETPINFLFQLLPSWGLEIENNELILCQNRECEGYGRRLRST